MARYRRFVSTPGIKYPAEGAPGGKVAIAPKIHVELDDETHRKLRVKVALKNETIQDYVSGLLAADVRGIRVHEDNAGAARPGEKKRNGGGNRV